MVYRAWIELVADHNHQLVSELDPSHGRVFLGLVAGNQLEISGAMPENCIQITLYAGYDPNGDLDVSVSIRFYREGVYDMESDHSPEPLFRASTVRCLF